MNIKEFNNTINTILEMKEIENIYIPNADVIKEIVFDDDLNLIIYNGFMQNYRLEYGNKNDMFISKIQDLLYRLHLLINHILIDNYDITIKENVYDAIFSNIKNNSINLYDAVSYDDSDIEELKNDLLLLDGINI